MADHRAVYEDLLRRYVAPLRRLAGSYVHDPAGRDDLFQEIAMAGIGSVGFVMAYLWWKHRGLQPLDPAADVKSLRKGLDGEMNAAPFSLGGF